MCRPVSGRPARARTDAAAGAIRAGTPKRSRPSRSGGTSRRPTRAPGRGVRREPGDLAHLLRPVGHDRGPLRQRPAQLRRGLEGPVEDDLRARHPGPAGDAVLEARGHIGPASRPVEAGHQAHEGVRLDRVRDRRAAARPRPGTRAPRPRCGHRRRRRAACRSARPAPPPGPAGGGRASGSRHRPGREARPHAAADPGDLLEVRVAGGDHQIHPRLGGTRRATPPRGRASPPARCPHRRARRGCRPTARATPSPPRRPGGRSCGPGPRCRTPAYSAARSPATSALRDQLAGRVERLGAAAAGDEVDAEPEAHGPAAGPVAHLPDALADPVRGLPPHQVRVGHPRGQGLRRLAGTAQVQRSRKALAQGVRQLAQARVTGVVVPRRGAVAGRPARPRPPG